MAMDERLDGQEETDPQKQQQLILAAQQAAASYAAQAESTALMAHAAQQQQQQLAVSQIVSAGLLPLSSATATLGALGLPAAVLTSQPHNLIPLHLQAAAIESSLCGTPGHEPALIPSAALQQLNAAAVLQSIPPPMPVLSVQDRPFLPPVYNGVNPAYPGLRLLHATPPVFCVDNFLTPQECNFLITSSQDSFVPAPVVGAGAGEVSPSRTSTTCYLAREDLPDYLRKIALLTGKPVQHCELPQVGRYFQTQHYLQHFDAFDLSNEDGRRFASNGGQRTVTVLVYLNDVLSGGETYFPALGLKVQPRQGMALIFFPATVDGLLDKMALHAALPAQDVKYVSQVWIRQGEYKGQPSKRLHQTMGIPFGFPGVQQQQQLVGHQQVMAPQAPMIAPQQPQMMPPQQPQMMPPQQPQMMPPQQPQMMPPHQPQMMPPQQPQMMAPQQQAPMSPPQNMMF